MAKKSPRSSTGHESRGRGGRKTTRPRHHNDITTPHCMAMDGDSHGGVGVLLVTSCGGDGGMVIDELLTTWDPDRRSPTSPPPPPPPSPERACARLNLRTSRTLTGKGIGIRSMIVFVRLKFMEAVGIKARL